MASTISDTSSNKVRTEAVIKGADMRMEYGEDYWIGFSVYLPDDWVVPGKFEALAQIRRTPDRGESADNLLGFYTGDGDWKITNLSPAGEESWVLNSLYEDVGRWTDWVIHIRPSYNSDGILEIWKDGALVAQRSGVNTERDSRGPFLSLGLYKGPYSVGSKTVYHDEVRVVSGSGVGYYDVAPQGGNGSTGGGTDGGSDGGTDGGSDSGSGGGTDGGTSEPASLDHEFSFNDGFFTLNCNGNCPEITSQVARAGDYAMASTLTDSLANTVRTEAVLDLADRFMEFDRDYWIGFSIYLPKDWVVPKKFEAVAQIRRKPDAGEKSSTIFGLYTGSGNWKVRNNSSHADKSWVLNDLLEDAGQWTDWVIHIRPSYTANGILEVWKDGELVAQRSGANTEEDAVGPYLSLGLYKGRYDIGSKTVYHDELRIASGSEAAYSDVAPGQPVGGSDGGSDGGSGGGSDGGSDGGTDGGSTGDSSGGSQLPLDYVYNFDGGEYNLKCSGNCPRLSTKYAREGNYSLESYLNRLTSDYSFRTESNLPSSIGKLEFNKDYWYGFSIYLPFGWEVPEKFEILAQFHSTLDPTDSSQGPPFAISTGSGEWKVLSRGHNVPQKEWLLNSVYEDIGRWTDWVIHYKPSYGSEGVLEVWKDDVLVAQRSGPNTHMDEVGPYFKMGVYLGWKDRDCCNDKAPEKTVYHDALRIATGENPDNYKAVRPR